MTPAVRLFFPLLLLSTLLKAGEADRMLLIRSLQEYCLQTRNPEERQAFEIRLAELQSVLADYRIARNEKVLFPHSAVFSIISRPAWQDGLLVFQPTFYSQANSYRGAHDRSLRDSRLGKIAESKFHDFPKGQQKGQCSTDTYSVSSPETDTSSHTGHSPQQNSRLQNGLRAVTLAAHPL